MGDYFHVERMRDRYILSAGAKQNCTVPLMSVLTTAGYINSSMAMGVATTEASRVRSHLQNIRGARFLLLQPSEVWHLLWQSLYVCRTRESRLNLLSAVFLSL